MTPKDKKALIHEQKTSGLTQVEFCAKKSIKLSAFRQWKYTNPKTKRVSPQFVELIPKDDPIVPIVIYSGHYRVEVPVGFDKRHLQAVLEAMPC